MSAAMTLDGDTTASRQTSPTAALPTPEFLPSPASITTANPESPESPAQPAPEKRTKAPTQSELAKNQELKITGKLLDPITITFSGKDERIRGVSNRLPAQFYRTFHEESKTLCAFMSKENQPKHREAEGVKILLRNAFQAIGAPDFAIDLTLNRLERHCSWQTVKGPSSWISVFNHLHWAIRRAVFHTNESTKIGHRISIAGISTKGLVAASVRAKYETTYQIIIFQGRGRPRIIKETYIEVHDVIIPVWIRENAVPADCSAITPRQLKKSGADLWVSITELRHSDLRNVSEGLGPYEEILRKGHDYEWLCLGEIRKTHITCIMPWDGKALHSRETSRIIWSKSSPEKYVFDWTICQWRLDPKRYALAVFRDRKEVLERDAARRKRMALKAEARKAGKSSDQKANNSPKNKRKRTLDEDGKDTTAKAPKIIHDNAQVWGLMIAAQKDACHCNNDRRTRAGSAQL